MPGRLGTTSRPGGYHDPSATRPPSTGGDTSGDDPPNPADDLLVQYERLAERCARRYAGRGEPYDDLVQVAWIGLIKAVARFDPARGNDFVAFATPTIRGELRRHFRDRSWRLSVPRGSKELRDAVRESIAVLEQALGRAPRRDEVARRLGVAPDAVTDAVRADRAYRLVSLDALRLQHGEDEFLVRAALTDESGGASARRIDAARAISELDERSRQIVYWRYFEECTQAEIGRRLDLGQAQVSRLLRAALERLREQLEPARVPERSDVTHATGATAVAEPTDPPTTFDRSKRSA